MNKGIIVGSRNKVIRYDGKKENKTRSKTT